MFDGGEFIISGKRCGLVDANFQMLCCCNDVVNGGWGFQVDCAVVELDSVQCVQGIGVFHYYFIALVVMKFTCHICFELI